MPEKYSPDQPIIKGRDVIYRPAGNAGEYAPLATNPWKGCGHGCVYCYVPNATHIDRALFNKAAVFRGEDYVRRLGRDLARHQHLSGGPNEQIFITFSSDPFHLGDLTPTRRVIEILHEGGLAHCTLSKGGGRALPFLSMYRPERDAYACTLTTFDDDRFSKRWEPFAALPSERVGTLRVFHDQGIFTWASLEPTIDAASSLKIIRETHSFVNLFKIGKANYIPNVAKNVDWRAYTLEAVNLCEQLGARYYIKRDLQEHLPAGYQNPLRVRQHH